MDRIGESLAPKVLWEPEDHHSVPFNNRNEAVRATAAGDRPTTYGYRPIPTDQYVEYDGTYYALDIVVTGVTEIDRHVLRLMWVGDTDDLEDPPEAIEHGDLPPIDRHAVKPAYFAARAREHDGGAPWDIIEEGGYVYRHLDDTTSELAPEPEHDHVRFNETILKVTVETKTLTEPAYTGVRIPIADSRAAFERSLDGSMVDARIEKSTLSGEAKTILSRGEYTEETPLSQAYEEVIRALGLRELLHTDDPPTAENGLHVSYDGTYYRFGLYVNPAN
jgi:hypothetical protein